MTPCWSEGALRAYLDRELATEEMQQVAAHLGNCTVCDGLCTELAARSAHVSALLELLPEDSGTISRPVIVTRRRVSRPGWIGIAAALAACLGLAAYLLPGRAANAPKEALVLPLARSVPPPADIVASVAPAPPELLAPRRARRARRSAPEPAYFVALDDEPFESGVIMRVDVKPGNLQADIVFGPDGRAHAFRLVSAAQRNF